ncbi:MAG TPA: hypothetical protein VFH68_25265 [Polyangia bacterium]|jgi:hypothetical protein|nr:hypothetical protein [Polyangia bacterium]
MTPVALFLALTTVQSQPPALSLGDRCALVSAILNAPAKQGVQGGKRPELVELSFLQTGPVRDSAMRRERVVVRPQWRRANVYSELFSSTESCDNTTFVLEQADLQERKGSREPTGNSDHVVVVTVKKAGRQEAQFTFEERLGLSIHARAPDGATGGGYAVPPIKFAGSARRTEKGSWIAKVKKAIFAS